MISKNTHGITFDSFENLLNELPCWVFAIIPFTMTVANRSSPLSAGFAAGCLFLTSWRGKTNTKNGSWRILFSSLGLLALFLAAFCLISLSWSAHPASSMGKWFGFFGTAVVVFFLFLRLPQYLKPRHFVVFAIASCLAGITIILELGSSFAIRNSFGLSAAPYIFNRSLVTLVLLGVPLCFGGRDILEKALNNSFFANILWGVVFLSISGALYFAESQTAIFAAITVLLAYPIVYFFPTTAFFLAGFGATLVFVIAPLIGIFLENFMPASFFDLLQSAHARERVEIWRGFGRIVFEHPLFGASFNASAFLPSTDIISTLSLSKEELQAVGMGHPHNTALQVWFELGIVGVMVVISSTFLMLRKLRALPVNLKRISFDFFSAIFLVSVTSHGAWQSWWAATIGIGIIWIVAIAHQQNSDQTESCSIY